MSDSAKVVKNRLLDFSSQANPAGFAFGCSKGKFSALCLALYLILASGCMASRNAELTNDEIIPQRISDADDTDPVESTILAKIPSSSAGVARLIGQASFVVGETFASASGLSCRTIAIKKDSSASVAQQRVVCLNDQKWFFSKDVFLMDSDND